MEPRRLISLMTFPQRFDGNTLTVNIVMIPRNNNPFDSWPTGLLLPEPTLVSGFADFQPEFSLAIIKGTDDFPLSNATAPGRIPILKPVPLQEASQKGNVIKQIADSMPLPITDNSDVLKPPVSEEKSIKKYLPHSYRTSFNFTQPRHKNAITDDGYHCAVREKVPQLVYQPRTSISWGKVFANILRQPLLAKACGMIYEVQLPIDPSWFENGGYLYAEITNGIYAEAQKSLLNKLDGPLIKRYAAKIPALIQGEARPVFAPVLFPVLYKKPLDPEPVPVGPWDELFMEAKLYDDGFAKIVHANQPVSGNLLEETQDELPPQSDAGIRLGWDDEQILVWYLRQMVENPAASGSGERLDAPLGVMGYHIDVKLDEPNTTWESLNVVQIKESENGLSTDLAGQNVELPYQVYPTKISGPNSDHFWLPMYYAHWIGKSLVTEDKDAMEIYRTNQDNGRAQNTSEQGKVNPNNALEPGVLVTQLRYGNSYQFRIRMADISGGGPALTDDPLNAAPSPETTVAFKRYVNPGMLRIEKPIELKDNKTTYFNSLNPEENQFEANPTLKIKRPLLEYPAVVFTNKYQKAGQDPIQMLKSLTFQADGLKPALPDPDVQKVQIRVEVKSLRMDTQLSQNGRDSFITLYKTTRAFPANFEGELEIPIEFIDAPVLNLGIPSNPFLPAGDDPDVPAGPTLEELNQMAGLILPTGRHIRISIRGEADSEEARDVYFGFNEDDEDKNSRFGKVQQLMFYKEPSFEKELLLPFENVRPFQALYMKPDPIPTTKQNIFSNILKREIEFEQSGVIHRLADALGLESKGLTLVAPKGERIAIGCSSRIRHTLAPDGSSITFATKADLYNHWVTCLSYKLNRDWTWDAHEDVAFVIQRNHVFRKDEGSEIIKEDSDLNFGETEIRKNSYLADIELKHTVSFEALQSDRFDRVNRNFTRIIYIDALEPKNELTQGATDELRFPDELWAEYTIVPKMRPGHADAPALTTDLLQLPTVLSPAQVPKIRSVGFAFSPYERAKDYSSTEARKRSLWVEFEHPIENPDDTYFCRMLANAPDQLIANNDEDQFLAPEESGLSIDPEVMRQIIPGQSDDKAGIGAMQPMEKATDSNTHFLLPIPPGLHHESAELFGFFTYEFRVGHGHWSDREDNLWSTAQGRFGRVLRVTGIQHPAPTLLCSLNRNENHLYVSAPYAKAVFNGKNVTSKPPRTSLWALLYAQVFQADGLDHRNILLGEKEMKIEVRVNTDPIRLKKINEITESIYFKPIIGDYKSGSIQLNQSALEMGNLVASIRDTQPVGTAVFTSQEIAERLKEFGLPEDSSLSVLVVEVFGNITNIHDHFQLNRNSGSNSVAAGAREALSSNRAETNSMSSIQPLSRGLGHFRILRTSPLTKVPFVCCPTC